MKNKGYVILEVVITFTMVAIFAISVYSIINQFTDYERKSFSQYNSLMNGVSITYNLKKD